MVHLRSSSLTCTTLLTFVAEEIFLIEIEGGDAGVGAARVENVLASSDQTADGVPTTAPLAQPAKCLNA